jgi:hypothetical protein
MGYVGSSEPEIARLWDAVWRVRDRNLVALKLVTPQGTSRDVYPQEADELKRRYLMWLPNANQESMSVDVVGVWIEMLDHGHREWEDLAPSIETRRWTVEVDGALQVITIHAATIEDLDSGMEAIHQYMSWARLIVDSIVDDGVSSFTLRDGAIVVGGVRRRVRYERV